MDGVGGCGCRLVWGRRGKAQVRELGRGQGNFKLAANFGYNSRGSADPRESLRKRRILKLALTAHKVSKPLTCPLLHAETSNRYIAFARFGLDTLTVIGLITVFSIIAFQKALHSAHLQLSRV